MLRVGLIRVRPSKRDSVEPALAATEKIWLAHCPPARVRAGSALPRVMFVPLKLLDLVAALL